MLQKSTSSTKDITIKGGIQTHLEHDSAQMHVTGEAIYVDDIREPEGTLHAHLVLSPIAHGRIKKIQLDKVLTSPGVVDVITASDIPGTNDFSHTALGDDRVFSNKIVEYHGQVIFAIIAETLFAARQAAKVAIVEYHELPPVLTIEQAKALNNYIIPPRTLKRGDPKKMIQHAKHKLSGRLRNGAQEHFYLEPQISLAVPLEHGNLKIYSATQDPTAVQTIVSRILDCPASALSVKVRRMGGGFGGKETVPTHFAAITAIAAHKLGRPVKCRLDRDVDMLVTGKRHEIFTEFNVGFNDNGTIEGIVLDLHGRCGCSMDQSDAILNRAIYHIDNCYFLEHVRATCHAWKTNMVSGVAFRGFGTPQAMLIIERILDAIARQLSLDPLEVRKINFYERKIRNTTPFMAEVKDNILDRLVPELINKSNYYARRDQITSFNNTSNILKKGIALTPIKYGIGFGPNFLNQAGALIHIYADGSIHVNHGGTEMGQGLHTKVLQVVANELQVDANRIKICATATDKVPNTIATAASSGTDLNAAAAKQAAKKIKKRLLKFAMGKFNVSNKQVKFLPNRIQAGNREISFDDLVHEAFMNRVSLSATGHVKLGENIYDAVTMTGQPHRYYVYGAAVAEVLVDTLTGENKTTRVDILHDVGQSLNPAIDMGQLEGGFIQGMGWLTTEEIVWDEKGKLKTHAPSTYKIPTCSDRPDEMRMAFVDWNQNKEESIFKSKAIGEPPLCLAISVLAALSDAIASKIQTKDFLGLNAPATPEEILMTLERGYS